MPEIVVLGSPASGENERGREDFHQAGGRAVGLSRASSPRLSGSMRVAGFRPFLEFGALSACSLVGLAIVATRYRLIDFSGTRWIASSGYRFEERPPNPPRCWVCHVRLVRRVPGPLVGDGLASLQRGKRRLSCGREVESGRDGAVLRTFPVGGDLAPMSCRLSAMREGRSHENGGWSRPVLAVSFLCLLIIAAIVFYAGLRGLMPFLNMEALLIVLAGHGAMVGGSHRITDLLGLFGAQSSSGKRGSIKEGCRNPSPRGLRYCFIRVLSALLEPILMCVGIIRCRPSSRAAYALQASFSGSFLQRRFSCLFQEKPAEIRPELIKGQCVHFGRIGPFSVGRSCRACTP